MRNPLFAVPHGGLTIDCGASANGANSRRCLRRRPLLLYLLAGLLVKQNGRTGKKLAGYRINLLAALRHCVAGRLILAVEYTDLLGNGGAILGLGLVVLLVQPLDTLLRSRAESALFLFDCYSPLVQ